MTAVNPTRLRHQIQELTSVFGSPSLFQRRMHNLFSLYANNALRFGDSASQRPTMSMYHLPHPVIRQLEQDLKPHINDAPKDALALADELWQNKHYEVRKLAVFILGSVPLNDPQPILSRLKEWLTTSLDRTLTLVLLSTGTFRLMKSFSEKWEPFISSYLADKDPKIRAIGIQALTESLKNPAFKNLPAVFRMVSPFIQDPAQVNEIEVEHLIETLAGISPKETAFVLKQALAISESPKAERLIMRCITYFPGEIQYDLKSTLKQ